MTSLVRGCCETLTLRSPVGGFWADVTIWGEKAERIAVILPKGARVFVIGTLRKERWTDKETGEARERDSIVADDITLDLSRVEEVRLRA